LENKPGHLGAGSVESQAKCRNRAITPTTGHPVVSEMAIYRQL